MSDDSDHRREVRKIFDAHCDDVWRVVHFLGVPESDVPDVCQDVFTTVHRRLGSFEGRSSINTWLYGICVNTVAAYRRKAFRRREQVFAEVAVDAESNDDPERTVIGRRRLDRLQRAILQLDEKQREVFVLYEVEKTPMKAIAEALEIPIQTGYSRLRAARIAVRRNFDGAREGAA